MRRTFLLLFLIMAAPAMARQDVQALADGLVEDGSPGAVVMLITGNSQMISVAGYRTSARDAAIDFDDSWHIGSNTKAMTAMLAARLVERDVINWDTTLGERLGERFDDIHPDLAAATLAELLQHRSGIAANAGRLTMIALSGTGDRVPRSDRRTYLREILRDPAGDRGEFLYSNAGYVAASLMLEEAAGESWERLIQREVFDELGLENAGFGPPPGDNPQGHRSRWGRLQPVGTGLGSDNPVAMNPAGRVHISMPDYALFLRLVLDGARGNETDYLSAASWDMLLTPPNGADYAMGWGVSADGSLRHAGSNTMWFLQASIWPDEQRIAVAGVNDGRIDRVAPRVRLVLDELAEN
ncbi:serine hydrolase domain-containing protein [Hyphobacterium sp.]|uniref:serine hydrolase domain-containing protein n=1 Tax=Hyphobacterium sp. TaxID=2004662 RepID=UPI003B521C02